MIDRALNKKTLTFYKEGNILSIKGTYYLNLEIGGIILSKLESMEDQKFVFGSVLIVANRMDTLLER